MAKVTIKLNGRDIICEEGETIVDVARKNGIFIPTICYLGGCSPTLACKMCMGESSDGKRVYTCNTKAKEGLEIFTENDELRKERRMIMQTYDVNHPLECGVCDKSGECELQDLTLYTQVAHQDYALSDDEKHEKSWAQALYDPNLCIMCERCVTTCKDNIGEAKLKAGKANLHSPDSYKDSMLKDPYSVWSKKQKSLIEFVSETPCVDCGECIAVCPVGALAYKDFSYSANAWELKKTASTCHYCSMGCYITYETRHYNNEGDKKIYRVSNDFQFAPICGAGRFGFGVISEPFMQHGDISLHNQSHQSHVDVPLAQASTSSIHTESITPPTPNLKNFTPSKHAGINQTKHLSTTHLSKAIEQWLTTSTMHINRAHAMRLGSSISNEEAMIASIMSETLRIKLYNESARAYQRFLPYLPLNHTLQELKDSKTIISIGCPMRLQAPLLQYAINNTIRTKKGVKFYYFHPIADELLRSFSRSVTHISYHPASIDIALGAVLLVLRDVLSQVIASQEKHELKDMLATLLHVFSIDSTPSLDASDTSKEKTSTQDTSSIDSDNPLHPILKEAGISLESFHALQELASSDITNISLILGEEALRSALNEDSMIVACAQILELCGVKIFIVPQGSNTAGIARICQLSAESTQIASTQAKSPPLHMHDTQPHTDSAPFIIGVRAEGDVRWDCAWSDGEALLGHPPHIALPSHQQMLGSLVNFESRVLPFTKICQYDGIDMAMMLYHYIRTARTHVNRAESSMKAASASRHNLQAFLAHPLITHFASYTEMRDYTAALPVSRGFSPRNYFSLANRYTQGGDDVRGYALSSMLSRTLARVAPITINHGAPYNAFISYPQNLFSAQNVLDTHLQQQDGFYTSKALLESLGLHEGAEVMLHATHTSSKIEPLIGRVYIDYSLSEDTWLISPYIAKTWGDSSYTHVACEPCATHTQGDSNE